MLGEEAGNEGLGRGQRAKKANFKYSDEKEENQRTELPPPRKRTADNAFPAKDLAQRRVKAKPRHENQQPALHAAAESAQLQEASAPGQPGPGDAGCASPQHSSLQNRRQGLVPAARPGQDSTLSVPLPSIDKQKDAKCAQAGQIGKSTDLCEAGDTHQDSQGLQQHAPELPAASREALGNENFAPGSTSPPQGCDAAGNIHIIHEACARMRSRRWPGAGEHEVQGTRSVHTGVPTTARTRSGSGGRYYG